MNLLFGGLVTGIDEKDFHSIILIYYKQNGTNFWSKFRILELNSINGKVYNNIFWALSQHMVYNWCSDFKQLFSYIMTRKCCIQWNDDVCLY